MARYKEYEKKDIVGSIRMDCYVNKKSEFEFKYRCIPDLGNEKDIVLFNNSMEAQKYMIKLGYKEWMV